MEEKYFSRKKAREVGKLLAFHMFVNDPSVVSYDSIHTKPGNLFIEISEQHYGVLLMNTMVNTININTPEFRSYNQFVEDVISSIVADANVVLPIIQNLRDEIIEIGGVDIGAESCLQIQLGVLEGVFSICNIPFEDLLPVIEEHGLDDVSLVISHLQQIHNTFCNYEVDIVQQLNRYPLEKSLHPYNPSYTGSNCYPNIKIFVFQTGWRTGYLKMLRKKIDQDIERTGRAPDIVVFPEFYIQKGGNISNENPIYRELSKICLEYGCYMFPGSIVERNGKFVHNTAPVISPDGEIIYKYRKRFPLNRHFTPGKEPGIIETKFGKIGVAICFDVENKVVVDDLIDQNIFLIINPVYISGAMLLENNLDPILYETRWKIAVESMAEAYQEQAFRHNFTLVRADHSTNTANLGSSQSIGPYSTIQSDDSKETLLTVYVDLDNKNNFYGNIPEYGRSRTEDNYGNRYIVKQVKNFNIADICFVNNAKFSKSQFASIDTMGNITLWKNPLMAPQQIIRTNIQNPIKLIVYTSGTKNNFIITENDNDRTLIHIWDTTNGSQEFEITGINLGIHYYNGYIVTVDHTKIVVLEISSGNQSITDLDGTHIASSDMQQDIIGVVLDETLYMEYVLENATLKLERSFSLNERISSFSISPNLVFGTDSGTIIIDDQQFEIGTPVKYVNMINNKFVLYHDGEYLVLFNLSDKLVHHTFYNLGYDIDICLYNTCHLLILDQINFRFVRFMQHANDKGLAKILEGL
eukprot:TRINITY_DN10770_c0_g1_i1.p1 TRINITY_DN10770_c0_g1~~TRINITY_DN10770_c0_g1_i1.p1  ORF type:complete len:871 (-),score=167.73 TRINITY_DN10770_c0_g1_i1:22-2277(-)